MIASEWEWGIRLVLAVIMSGVIGWERERHGREAGLRTTILVGMGTAMIMIVSLRINELFAGQTDPRISLDPARIAYGVVTGIGFLGAGAIVKDAQRVRGLTTAACLWATMAISLTVGCGFYGLAFLTTGLSLVTLNGLKILEHKIPRDNYSSLKVTIAGRQTNLEKLQELILQQGLTILTVGLKKETSPETTIYFLTLRYRGFYEQNLLLDQILSLPGVSSVEWK
ncbi:MAG: MgtC/SapB family protein [Candidatus Omnitrophica bacterium]|nr:MgtC/SapB family protein [Candidatus Omnitrophota bacterium]